MYNRCMKCKGSIVSGQTVLMIVLVMTLALTVGLSLISRTTTDIRVTSQFEESARAFSAAEAGIEESLASFGNASGNYDNGVTYNSTIDQIGQDGVYQLPITSTVIGQASTIFLAAHDQIGNIDWTNRYTGSLRFCWKQATEGDPMPAIELTFFKKTLAGVYSTQRFAYDSQVRANGFDRTFGTDDCGTGNTDLASADIFIVNTPMSGFVRVRPYYSDAVVYIEPLGSATFPSQGNLITSTGGIPGGATRKITVVRQFKTPPSLFDYVLFSGGAITQN